MSCAPVISGKQLIHSLCADVPVEAPTGAEFGPACRIFTVSGPGWDVAGAAGAGGVGRERTELVRAGGVSPWLRAPPVHKGPSTRRTAGSGRGTETRRAGASSWLQDGFSALPCACRLRSPLAKKSFLISGVKSSLTSSAASFAELVNSHCSELASWKQFKGQALEL